MDKAVLAGGGIRLSGPGRTTHAYLWFWGEDLEPGDVTTAMRLQPTKAWRRGDPAPGRESTVGSDGTETWAPGPRTHRQGHWGLTFEPPEGLMADEVVTWLLDELEPHRDVVARLGTQFDGQVVLSMRAEYSHVGIGFDGDLLGRLTSLSLRVEIGIAFEPDPVVFDGTP